MVFRDIFVFRERKKYPMFVCKYKRNVVVGCLKSNPNRSRKVRRIEMEVNYVEGKPLSMLILRKSMQAGLIGKLIYFLSFPKEFLREPDWESLTGSFEIE